jgi:peptidoglycan/LPS O-acetylase OafA/YrhL
MPVKKEKKDVARTTILVLLVLTILLSVISTWYVLDMINSVKQQYASVPSVAHGQVSVTIAKPEAQSNQT